MTETVNLEVDNDVTLQDTVIKDEVGLEIVLVNEDALLTGFKAEPASHFHQHHLEMIQDNRFQSGLGVNILRLQAKEFKGIQA